MRIATTIAAFLLATNVSANSCHEATQNTRTLMNDVTEALEAITQVDTATASEAEMHRAISALERRAQSVRRSLISVRIYCHQNAQVISWSNRVEDMLDRLER